MKLTNEFTVPASIDRAYAVLLDVERVAPCLPGAALDGRDGDAFSGTMKIKLGPVTSEYRGTVSIEDADERAHRAVLRAQATDASGRGRAAATITTVMQPVAEGTRVAVETDLRISGPAAQFGRGVMQDVSGKLMRQFADCLAEEVRAAGGHGGAGPAVDDVQLDSPTGHLAPSVAVAGGPEYHETSVGRLPVGPAADAALAAAAATAPRTAPTAARERPSADVLDLGAASRGAVLKRLVLALAGGVLGAVIAIVIWRRSTS